MATETLVRTIEGIEVPAPGTYVIDPAHTTIEAVARHLVMAKVRGRFGEFSGTIHIDEDPSKSWAEATIKAASIDTANPDRDEHLRSPDFLDAENHPELTFRSTSVEHKRGNDFEVVGDLTIRGVTNPVTLEVELAGMGTDPWGNARAFFSATGELEREDWGITWNQALETGGVLVGKKLTLEIEAQGVRQ